MIGKSLGPYEILEPLGAGGMGEVYRARDSTLKRDVAIKLLPEALASDPERVARLKREAHSLAALMHPNVAVIHGLEETDGVVFLVLELVEGDTLEERLRAGPLVLEEALRIAGQIAEGLEAAHGAGIIHRDLKPANIKITPDGRVKVLDFGLAKPSEGGRGRRDDGLTHSPTLTVEATKAGVLLGTAAYMSPEQARGHPLDKRTDIWSFGCVLYEMLAGPRVFLRETVSDTLAAILEHEPDWGALPTGVPSAVRSLLGRCLQKDPRFRLRDVGDAWIEIQGALQEPAGDPATTGDNRLTVAPPRPLWPLIAGAVTIALVATALTWTLKPEAQPSVRRFALSGVPGVPVRWSQFHSDVAISPDGRYVVYYATIEGQRGLFRRGLDRLEGFTLLARVNAHGPFFSPDGEWVAFEDPSAPPMLRRVPVGGGPVETIGPLPNPSFAGGSWGPDDTIVFGSETTGLMRIADGGGEGEELTTPAEGESHMWPEFLPDGRSILFTIRQGTEPDESHIAVLDLETGDVTTLFPGIRPRYVEATGHLVFGYGSQGFPTRSSLLATTFDLSRRAPRGEAVQLLDGLIASPRSGVPLYAISDDGSLVYVIGDSGASQRALALVDHDLGGVEPLDLPAAHYLHPRVSPDGASILYQTTSSLGRNDIWVYRLAGDTQPRKLTLEGNNVRPIWTPDGARVTYASDRDGTTSIYWQPTDGGSSAELLVAAQEGETLWPDSWSIDNVLSFTRQRPGDQQIWTLQLGNEDGPQPLATEPPLSQQASAFSPDGRWIAYTFNLGRGFQILVQPYPSTGDKHELARGLFPHWSPQGDELFFRTTSTGSSIMAVEVSNGFERGPVRTLPVQSLVLTAYYRDFDLMPDGERMVAVVEHPAATPSNMELYVVLNWTEELRRLVPAER